MSSDRTANLLRQTKETKIELAINLDGRGDATVSTGVGFFDHMLDLLSRHSLIDLDVTADGDLQVDAHHTVEDVGIVLGQAIEKAVGDKRGIQRYGWAIVPMDESLAQVAVDLSGRPAFVFNVTFTGPTIGDFQTELVEEFLKSLSANARMNLHVTVPYGTNNHHIAEAVFKALARALRQAVSKDPRSDAVPSTKGSL
jgi:imidazoleglycerol-phosphate dehydratase